MGRLGRLSLFGLLSRLGLLSLLSHEASPSPPWRGGPKGRGGSMGYGVSMSWLGYIFAIRFIVGFLSSLGLVVFASVTAARAADLEHQVHRLVNEHRVSQGLKPLAFNPEISAIARRHSRNMATGRVGYGHGGIERRRQEIARFIVRAGVGENVHTIMNYKSSSHVGAKAVADWLESPGHRRNIEGSYDLTGVGIAQGPAGEYFLTQLFVRTPSYRPGTSGSDTPYTRSTPASRDRKSEPRVVETRQPDSYKRPPRKPRREKDPRKRPGRKRTADGWVQTLD